MNRDPSLTVFVLAYITDFFFQSKVTETAKQVGVPVQIVTSTESFEAQLERDPSLIIVDLASEGQESQVLIARAKALASTTPLVAFGIHLNADLLRKAAEAGADYVMPRSEFSGKLPEILDIHEGRYVRRL